MHPHHPSQDEGDTTPTAQAGEVANLTIVAVSAAGALLAGGPGRNLPLPAQEVKFELKHKLKVGKQVLVFLFLDEADRVTASTRVEDFLTDQAEGLQEGDKVDLVIWDPTDIGVRVIVNHRFWGMVHHSDLFSKLTRGERRVGYIKALRADQKLNISLSPPGHAKVDDIAQGLLDVLKRRGGFLPVTDKSPPEAIYALFGISKKVFKQTLGALYKNRQILIGVDGIRLTSPK